ncbi:MAG TPA: PD-(D/E)XK nuclease family protein [Pseudonocardia sp.]|nr:PD-(D/E)XK nuclease family protein [Pseudonocardia sp.]
MTETLADGAPPTGAPGPDQAALPDQRAAGDLGTTAGQGAAAVQHTGADPEPRRRPALSPSRAGDFKQCPLLYRFRAIDRLPERPTRAQIRGTLVHAVLERLFELPAEQRLPAAAHALVEPVWADLQESSPGLAEQLFDSPDGADGADGDSPAGTGPDSGSTGGGAGTGGGDSAVPTAHPDRAAGAAADPGAPADGGMADWLASAGPLLDAYFRLEDPRRLQPEARELLVEAELESGLLLRGYIDRLDVAPTGEIRVVDYKTGAAPREVAETRALFQMKFYALALLHQRGVVPAQLRLLYLADTEWLSYTPDEEELRRFERTLEAIWAAVLLAGRDGDFRPNRGRPCDWCSHKARCPAWGGTPPPYPGWPADPAAVNAEDTPADRFD